LISRRWCPSSSSPFLFLGTKIAEVKVNPAKVALFNLMLAKRQACSCRRWENTAIKDETIREAYYAKLVGEPTSQDASP
jgi:hypothetical protein